ncbi:MAG: 4-phosphoerythronate dehydrogenase [Gammaproteobacteria bacterium]
MTKIVADQQIPFLVDYFGQCGELIARPGRAINAEDVQDADVLLVRSITHVDEKLLAGSNVKFVGSITAGSDHLDKQWLEANNIAWNVAEGFNAPPVADYVISTIAALQRKEILPLSGMKAAVIGVGNVGRLVEKHLRSLGAEVLLCDPLRATQDNNFTSIALEDVADVDLITLHVPLTRTGDHPTFHFLNQSFFERQKSGTVFINASRGSIVDVDILKKYATHLYWCFDVWQHEPNIDKEILARTMTASPHIAGYSVQSKMRGVDMIYRIACDKKIIQPQAVSSMTMPTQTLKFTGDNLHWQDAVLAIYNPLIMSAMMRAKLLEQGGGGAVFDDMRHQFNYRYEFGFTSVEAASLLDEDVVILHQLGIKVV